MSAVVIEAIKPTKSALKTFVKFKRKCYNGHKMAYFGVIFG
jgi:hypothetical protein